MGRGFIGDGWAILGHRSSMPGARGEKSRAVDSNVGCGAPSYSSLVTSGRCARPTSQRGSLQALLVRCPRSHRGCYARVVADASSGTRIPDTANRRFTRTAYEREAYEREEEWRSCDLSIRCPLTSVSPCSGSFQLASEQGFPRPRHRADGTRVWHADVIERWADRAWWGSKPWRERVSAPR
jgi:hypothetical protein